MGIFSQESAREIPSPDDYLSSVLATYIQVVNRTFKIHTKEQVPSGDFEMEDPLDSLRITMDCVRDVCQPMFKYEARFNNVIRASIVYHRDSPITEILKSGNDERFNGFIEDEPLANEVYKILFEIREGSLNHSGFTGLKNPLLPYPEGIAYSAAEYALSSMFTLVPCFLNDFESDWTSQRVCTHDDGHVWNEIARNWKTSPSTNEFFTAVTAMMFSTLVLDPLKAGSTGRNKGQTLDFWNASEVGFRLLVRTLLFYKQKNAVL